MNILIISQYFWPENFKINDIALGLRDRGHTVTILTAFPNYPQGTLYDGYDFSKPEEYWNNIKIYRSRIILRGKGGGLRLFLNYFSFSFFASLKILKLKEKFDSILVFEPSPITVGIPAIVAKNRFKIPYSFWVQDLWPDSLTAAGGVKNKLIIWIFDKITRWIYRNAKYVLIQSKAFKKNIVQQDVADDKIVYIPNTTEDYYYPIQHDVKYKNILPKDGFNIIFAGNIGESQCLETMLKAMLIIKEKGYSINWVIIGDGRSRKMLESKVEELQLKDCIFFLGQYPPTEMSYFFSTADALYVTLKKDYIFSLTIPSKLQSYMACAKPIIASLDGEGASIIDESNCGLVSPSEEVNGLVDNIIKMYNMSSIDRETMGNNGLDFFYNEFRREVVLNKIEDVLR